MKAHQRVYIPLRRIFRRNQYNKSNNETSFRPIQCLPSSFSAASALYSIHERYITARRFTHASRMLRDLPYIDFRRQDGYCRMLHIHLEIRNSWASRSLLLGGVHLIFYCYRTNGFDYTVRQLMLLFYLRSFYRYMWVHTNPAAQSIITQFHFDRQNSNSKAPAAVQIILSYISTTILVIPSWKPWESYETSYYIGPVLK